jgi:hypothetical protein
MYSQPLGDFMRDFTEDDYIAIENAFEEMMNLLDEQVEEYGECDFPQAYEDVCWSHDLDDDQCEEVKAMYDAVKW